MTKIIQRHDTSTNWTSVNPILALGEMGIETDTNKFKFGDGVTNWTELAYASAEGGGADLSDYYTKEETYNQEEVDTLLDAKQDVLTPSDPIEIGTSTIGEPNNINIVGDKIIASTTTNFPQITGSTSGITFIQRKNTATVVDTFNSSFKDLPYFDIALNFANYFSEDYSSTETLNLNISGMESFNNSNWADIYIGKLSGDSFEPYIVLQRPFYNSNMNVGILNALPELTSTQDAQTQWTATSNWLTLTTSYEANTDAPLATFSLSKTTTGTLDLGSLWFNGTRKYTSTYTTASTSWDLNTLRNCNVIRVAFRSTDITGPYSPTVTGTYLEYNGSRLSWNIGDGIVTTYGISLKYDNQTIQVNANGELVANLDELGNEVNAIASQVSTNTIALGGNKIVSLTQAEYDALATKDPNTVYIITDGPDGTYALSDLSNVSSTITSIPPTSLTNFDGQWVNIGGNHLNTSTAVGTYTADLSEILPSDGYDYELLVGVTVNGQQSTFSSAWVGSDICGLMQVGGCSGSTADSINTFIIPVGQGRYLTKEVRQVAPSNCYLTLWAYRRLGTNQ